MISKKLEGQCLVDQSNRARLRLVRSGRLRGPRTRLYMAILLRPSAIWPPLEAGDSVEETLMTLSDAGGLRGV